MYNIYVIVSFPLTCYIFYPDFAQLSLIQDMHVTAQVCACFFTEKGKKTVLLFYYNRLFIELMEYLET